MKKLFLIALLGIFAFAAYAADVTGTWKAEVPGRQGTPQPNTFVFKQAGTALTGTFDRGRGGPVEITNGKVEGDTVTFDVVQEFQGNKVTQKYKGTVSGSDIKFTRTMEGGPPPVEFVAKKSTT
jgi:hypothetical protein